MASNQFEVFSVAMVMLCLCGVTMAQSGCTTALVSLSPCLGYVSGNSSTPSTSCCSQLANVVQSQPQCLCVFTGDGSGAPPGLNINQTLALALPGACTIQTPPVSRCTGMSRPYIVTFIIIILCNIIVFNFHHVI
ncbi:putative plant lipid transfer protein/Par allergen [Helianthus anomalus]